MYRRSHGPPNRRKKLRFRIHASLCATALLAAGTLASAKTQAASGYQQGTILKVERQEVRSPNLCCYSGTDTPLQADSYAFEITVQVGCTNYEGRYETPFDYFPSAFSPGKSVQVRPTKHALYFEAPIWTDGKVPIVHRASDRSGACGGGQASR